MAKLDKWSIVGRYPDAKFVGHISRDKRFDDGVSVTTSRIKELHLPYAITRTGTEYLLGSTMNDQSMEDLLSLSHEMLRAREAPKRPEPDKELCVNKGCRAELQEGLISEGSDREKWCGNSACPRYGLITVVWAKGKT